MNYHKVNKYIVNGEHGANVTITIRANDWCMLYERKHEVGLHIALGVHKINQCQVCSLHCS